MSRWINNYNNHAFHTVWKDFKNTVNDVNMAKIDNADWISEIDRLKKIIIFIDNYLILIDPEIMSYNAFIDFVSHTMQSTRGFAAYYLKLDNSAAQIGALRKMNDLIDTSLKFITQIPIALPSISSDSISSMLGKYSHIIEDLTNKYSKIKKYYDELLTDNQDKKSMKTELIEAQTVMFIKIKDLESNIKDSLEKIKEFDAFYEKIYGSKLGNYETNTNGGLNKEFDDLINKQKEKADKLLNQIDGLLKGATKLELASAFEEERQRFYKPIQYWTVVFALTLLAIAGLGWYKYDLNNIESINKLATFVLHLLPISAPLFWLAIFASRRRSENRRLEQEYAHKVSLAQSYIAYKDQINQLSELNKELTTKLLQDTLNAISYNPSTTLDKKHGDDPVITKECLKFIKLIIKNCGNNFEKLITIFIDNYKKSPDSQQK